MNIISKVNEITNKFIKVLGFGKSDIRTAYNTAVGGIDSKPIKGDLAILATTQESGESIVLGYINKESTVSDGEIKIFSRDANGTEQTFIHIKNDGTIEIAGTGDFLVGFNELKTGFDELKSDFNTFLTHVHGGAGTPPAPPQLPSTASIDSAKKEDIKVVG